MKLCGRFRNAPGEKADVYGTKPYGRNNMFWKKRDTAWSRAREAKGCSGMDCVRKTVFHYMENYPAFFTLSGSMFTPRTSKTPMARDLLMPDGVVPSGH